MTEPSRILIVEGGWQRGTLAATRALGAAGHRVSIASEMRGHSARSRWTASWFPVPGAAAPELPGAVEDIVRSEDVEVVFAGDDEHLLVLSEHRGRFEPASFPYVDHAAVLRALDKVSLYEAASRAGIDVPETRVAPPVTGELAGELGWIAKPRLYRPGTPHDHHEASTIADGDHDLVFQRVVPGSLVAVVVFVDAGGEVQYAAAQRAEAVHPEPFGVSVRARVVPMECPLVTAIGRLFAELPWFGAAEVQFIVAGTGVPHLIDFNGRFFGSLALTSAAGVDLPSAWAAAAAGGAPALGHARVGTRYQWLEGDLRRAVGGARGRAREVARAMSWAPGAAHSLWAARDPGPAVRHAGSLAVRALKKVRR